jgi:hypothetical protein
LVIEGSDGRGGQLGSTNDKPLQFGDLDPVVASEILRDLTDATA